jgi:hypothetical protein
MELYNQVLVWLKKIIKVAYTVVDQKKK